MYTFGQKAANLTGQYEASGDLEFLNSWKYELGREILVPRGRQELFESGVLHYYQYAQLYNPNSKIIVRTTTQDRMLKVCVAVLFDVQYADIWEERRVFHGGILWFGMDQQRDYRSGYRTERLQ